jgi:hypothetical protein
MTPMDARATRMLGDKAGDGRQLLTFWDQPLFGRNLGTNQFGEHPGSPRHSDAAIGLLQRYVRQGHAAAIHSTLRAGQHSIRREGERIKRNRLNNLYRGIRDRLIKKASCDIDNRNQRVILALVRQCLATFVASKEISSRCCYCLHGFE